jgi:hypothetical protein
MPTYLNSGTTVANIGLYRIEPGESKVINEYISSLPTGVTQTSATPYFDPVVSSAKLTGTTTVTVDSALTGNYRIRVYVGVGECTVKLNGSAAVDRYVGLYETYTIDCMTRAVDNVIVTISSGTVYVTVERI